MSIHYEKTKKFFLSRTLNLGQYIKRSELLEIPQYKHGNKLTAYGNYTTYRRISIKKKYHIKYKYEFFFSQSHRSFYQYNHGPSLLLSVTLNFPKT